MFSSALRLSTLTLAMASTNVLPAQSGLIQEAGGSSLAQHIEYAGQTTLSGVLQAYWVPSWPDGSTEQRTLFMRFFPDAQSLRSLPRIEEAGRPPSQATSIQIYRDTALVQ